MITFSDMLNFVAVAIGGFMWGFIIFFTVIWITE